MPHDRLEIEKAFGPAFDSYGCREVMLMAMECEAGMASILAAVRLMTILSWLRAIGPPLPSNRNTLNVFSPGFDKLSSTLAPSFKTTRPEDQPVSKLSI